MGRISSASAVRSTPEERITQNLKTALEIAKVHNVDIMPIFDLLRSEKSMKKTGINPFEV
jgi:hypothetical protein